MTFRAIFLVVVLVALQFVVSGCITRDIQPNDGLSSVTVEYVHLNKTRLAGKRVSVSGYIVFSDEYAVLHQGEYDENSNVRPNCFGEGEKYLNIWMPYNGKFRKKKGLSGQKVIATGIFSDGYTGEIWLHNSGNNGYSFQNGPLTVSGLSLLNGEKCRFAEF